MNKLYPILSMISLLMIRLIRPGGIKALVAENLLLRQQLLTLSRTRRRSPRLTLMDRLCFGFLSALIQPKRLTKLAIALKPATLIQFHQALVKRKYRQLYSAKSSRNAGPKGPEQAIIDAVIAIKQRNPRFGYRRIAMQIALTFNIDMDKDTVRRILAKHPRNKPKLKGPSWLTFLGHMKDSLWSLDVFRCESIALKTHWVMVMMDQFTRRLIGFAAYAGQLDGVTVCCLFNKIIAKKNPLPKYVSSDNDPLFTFHRWQANLRILEIKKIKSVVPSCSDLTSFYRTPNRNDTPRMFRPLILLDSNGFGEKAD